MDRKVIKKKKKNVPTSVVNIYTYLYSTLYDNIYLNQFATKILMTKISFKRYLCVGTYTTIYIINGNRNLRMFKSRSRPGKILIMDIAIIKFLPVALEILSSPL